MTSTLVLPVLREDSAFHTHTARPLTVRDARSIMRSYSVNYLLTQDNKKIVKSEGMENYMGTILHLAPANAAGEGNLCPYASKGCVAACLNTAGNGRYTTTQLGRNRRTQFFMRDRQAFLMCLEDAIERFVVICKAGGFKPAVRLNGTSDVSWETVAPHLFKKFPGVQYYDYTKNPRRMFADLPDNYDLTFSRSEENHDTSTSILKAGRRVAVVFDKVPETWEGFPVVNGDEHDFRFIEPQGVIAGLKSKGKGRSDQTGFVVRQAA